MFCGKIEMKPYFTLFEREIPIYGVFFYIGIFIAAGVALLISPHKKVERYEIAYSGVYTMIGAMLGSKLLFIAVSLKQIIRENIPLEAVIKGGFVFYGGLIGGILGLFIYCKQYKVAFAPLCEIMATVLPIGHAFGRTPSPPSLCTFLCWFTSIPSLILIFSFIHSTNCAL